ncbi:hypothetical protein [Maritimibacter fusiformis]|uniref:Uncharacterized protein n=1 Tax=Maritimibacter fusiformis TaxID=2603819 RepID=A0A5D0RP94_9RHOB|nr:hypothetical protein [Maritimibacter fusiformis]TYB82468.1 hypothetical protein FVF75_07060 [Maritimibacter fusiformis]
MSEVRSYAFKPALLRARRTYRLDDTTLFLRDDTPVDLAAITGAGFVNHSVSRNRIMRLDLWVGAEKHSIGYNAAEAAWRIDPDARDFLRLVRDVLGALAETRPDLEVTLGEVGKARFAMFLVGVVSAVIGVALFVAALATGISTDRVAAGAIPMLLMLALGAIIIRTNWPWRAPPTGKAGAVADVVDQVIDGLEAA